jgi:putative Holliday junction resolvase
VGAWLAVDYGTVRIGLAVGDTEMGIASPLEVVPAEPRHEAFARVVELAREYHVEGIVVGLPLNMDDTVGPQAELTRRAAEELAEATGMDVRLWDERLSSFQADSELAGHMTRNKRRARQDALAAAAFLGDFLQGGGPETAERATGAE